MRQTFLAAVMLPLLLAVPLPADAEEPSGEPAPNEQAPNEQAPNEQAPGELAREGVARLLQALEVFIEMIPQYEMPELNENGDIIIRRKRDRGEEPSAEPDDDQTST